MAISYDICFFFPPGKMAAEKEVDIYRDTPVRLLGKLLIDWLKYNKFISIKYKYLW